MHYSTVSATSRSMLQREVSPLESFVVTGVRFICLYSREIRTGVIDSRRAFVRSTIWRHTSSRPLSSLHTGHPARF